MEENEITPAPDYVKGFNEGYLITKHMPELSKSLASAMVMLTRSEGFKDGKKQFEIELEKGKDNVKEKDNTPNWLKPDRLKNLDKGTDATKQKDRDDKEK